MAEVTSGDGPEMRSPSNKGETMGAFQENGWVGILVKGKLGLERKKGDTGAAELEMFSFKQHWKKPRNFPPS